ncbi:snare associated Golgi protein-domain-containing protein, partial [Sporodiniella umbellata]
MSKYGRNDYSIDDNDNNIDLDFPDTEQQPMLHEIEDEIIYYEPPSRPTWKQLLPRLGLFVCIGLISLAFSLSLAHYVLDIGLLRTLDDVKETATKLEEMIQTSWTGYQSVTIVFAVLYLWQQAFSIPGSVLLNLLAGYLYGIGLGTLWTSLLTASGATLAYGLSMLVGEPLLRLAWVERRAQPLIKQLETEANTFWWLLFLRLFPFSPYWFINLISPLLGITVSPFFWSTFFGVIPYNFVCAQAGDVLSDLTSTSDILSFSLMFKLLVVSLVSLIPVIWGKKIQGYLKNVLGLSGPGEKRSDVELDERPV